MFDGDFNPSDELQTLPVVEGEAVAAGNSQQVPPKDPLGPKLRLERLLLFEVLEGLDTRGPLPNSIPETMYTMSYTSSGILHSEGETVKVKLKVGGLTQRSQRPTQIPGRSRNSYSSEPWPCR